MKTLQLSLQKTCQLAQLLDHSVLSKFMIGRKIAGLFRNKTHRNIFLALWFGKTIVFYWIIL